MSSDREEPGIKALIATSNMRCEEAALRRVLEMTMRMMIKAADATSGQLMLSENGNLRLHARAWHLREVVVQIGASLNGDPLAWSIAHTVARSAQALAFDTAADTAQMFALSDAPARFPCSVLCFPLSCRGHLVAVLYLENDRIEKAFSATTRSLLDLLAPQIAIVLDDANGHPALQYEEQEQSLAEAELRQVQFELSRASRVAAIAEVVASITHEMSQPLSAIDASSSAGLRWLQRDAPNLEETIISLEKVRSCAIRARKIIDDLRSQSSHSKMPDGRFDIRSAIREVVLLARPRIDGLGCSVAFADTTAAQQVIGNRVQIQLVIENLIVNAIEAMADITTRARIVRISSANEGQSIIISIADSGSGIAHEWEETLFRPLISTKKQGMGMGLPICKRIIEAHGGTIWFEKTSPFGSRVSFTLDRVQHDHAAAETL
jgi:C4-dicarboxylate-specific signal transduction histidine kinase